MGEFVSEGTGDKLDERLEVKLDGDETFSLSQSTSLMMIILGDNISTSSSELPSEAFVLLLSSLDIRNVNLFLLKRFFRFRHGSVSGKGV